MIRKLIAVALICAAGLITGALYALSAADGLAISTAAFGLTLATACVAIGVSILRGDPGPEPLYHLNYVSMDQAVDEHGFDPGTSAMWSERMPSAAPA